MSPHSDVRFVTARRFKLQRAIRYLAAVIICLSTVLPVADLSIVVHAQTMLPMVIQLPPSLLQSDSAARVGGLTPPNVTYSNVAKVDAAALHSAPVIGEGQNTVSKIVALRTAEVRATELRGLLPHQFDQHYFGLEGDGSESGFVVTLVVEPAALLQQNAVNFAVLTAEGMRKFVAGADLMDVKSTVGSSLLFDQMNTRLTALLPGNADSQYTVVVFNHGKQPVSYQLQVQGGILVDKAGQSFSAIEVTAPSSVTEASNAKLSGGDEMSAMLDQLLPNPVRARRMSGALANFQERHFLNVATDVGGGEIELTLRYQYTGGLPTQVNFWVMTQDGVRHLVQGGLPQELNLATGLPVAGETGVYQTRLHLAEGKLYTVVLFSDGLAPADYTLSVQGGILVDRYGQTRESRVAQMEILALTGK